MSFLLLLRRLLLIPRVFFDFLRPRFDLTFLELSAVGGLVVREREVQLCAHKLAHVIVQPTVANATDPGGLKWARGESRGVGITVCWGQRAVWKVLNKSVVHAQRQRLYDYCRKQKGRKEANERAKTRTHTYTLFVAFPSTYSFVSCASYRLELLRPIPLQMGQTG